MAKQNLSATFSHVAQWTAQQCGRASTFILACVVIIVWAVTGPVFDYSDTWQLIINTGTTIVTFLMVFLMQNTQNRDTASIQLKLDELIRANENARNAMLSLEDLTEEQLKRIKATFDTLAKSPMQAQRKLVEASEELEAASAKVERPQKKVLDAAESAMGPAPTHDNAKLP
jgi:low affinity Fe/Cu permease